MQRDIPGTISSCCHTAAAILVLMSVALSSPQAEGGGSHTAKGVCEAAARVWGAAEPAHQGGPARLWVSVPLGLLPYGSPPHPTGDPLPYCLRRLTPSTSISSQPTSFPGTPAFLFSPWILPHYSSPGISIPRTSRDFRLSP